MSLPHPTSDHTVNIAPISFVNYYLGSRDVKGVWVGGRSVAISAVLGVDFLDLQSGWVWIMLIYAGLLPPLVLKISCEREGPSMREFGVLSSFSPKIGTNQTGM